MPRGKGLYPKFLSVAISERLHEDLKAKAEAREESMGVLVRTLIRERIERGASREGGEARQRSAVGRTKPKGPA